jgi:tRNA pseudouridine38-40 synthase
MQFQRAARTDKGVSAAANLINLKMELRDESLNELNDALPKQIRVYGGVLFRINFCRKFLQLIFLVK